ncbi:hypothetical protein CNR22_18060 [Sphingobacteriaceae bacterium]|nr:hypothetical protein CNR22_18060 [Sphingobacteriaceae bacterium]
MKVTKGNSFVTKLNRPYYLEMRVSKRWSSCFFFSSFVFLFLLIFQPFGLSSLLQGINEAALAFGLTTFILMAFLNVLVVPLFPTYFSEETWTVQKELYWNVLNVLIIGLGNALCAASLKMIVLSPYSLLIFELYTITIAIFPIAFMVFVKESRLHAKYSRQSAELNGIIEEHKGIIYKPEESPAGAKTEIPEPGQPTFTISSENQKENLELRLQDLIFIQSSDNYVEVHYTDKNQSRKKLLRTSLKAVASDLEKHKELFRCHKSYLVNVARVKHVSGNAQGYKLHLSGTDLLLPVSRQYNAELKERLNL